MPVTLFMDEHVPKQITIQLRRRGVDVRTVIEEGVSATPDDEILEHACMSGWIFFTQDIRFRVLAEDWQRQGRPFSGLLYGH
jgi:predicted nuclease of predicted toxin-antitoxin system